MKKFSQVLIEGTTFDKVISEYIDEKAQKASKKYNLPSGSGMIKVAKSDQKTYMDLFYLSGADKTVGNGEISLYWLFNYNNPDKPNSRCKENRGGHAADLVIDGKQCEVKSYPQASGKINLGRFASASKFRLLLSYVFGIESLFVALDPKSKSTSFNSENTFLFKNLLNSMIRVQELNKILEKNSELTNTFPIFKNIKKNIDLLYKELGKGKPTDQAAALARMLIEFKVGKKPGDGGYLINCHAKKPLDIYCHFVDFDKFQSKSAKNIGKVFAVSSAQVKIDFGEFS